jgi:hypothetical protein
MLEDAYSFRLGRGRVNISGSILNIVASGVELTAKQVNLFPTEQIRLREVQDDNLADYRLAHAASSSGVPLLRQPFGSQVEDSFARRMVQSVDD